MRRKYIWYYLIEISVILTGIIFLLCRKGHSYLFPIIIIAIYGFSTLFISSHRSKNNNEKSAFLMMLFFSLLYLALIYLLGLYFGYYYSSVKFSLNNFVHYIFPLALTIFFTEKIRYRLIKCDNLVSRVLLFIGVVLIDINICGGYYDLHNLNDFSDMIGSIVATNIINNVFFHYYAINFKIRGVVLYKLITMLYQYVIPIIPDFFTFFNTFISLTYAYFMYYYLSDTYVKKRKKTKENKSNVFSTILIIAICGILVFLVSCKFSYGIMVVASESMHGTIEKGDVVFFKSYTSQTIKKNDIIIFTREDTILIHRVIDILNYDSIYQYITKGDDNSFVDNGYSTKDDIVGTYIFHIKYIGYPTLWIRDIFGLS